MSYSVYVFQICGIILKYYINSPYGYSRIWLSDSIPRWVDKGGCNALRVVRVKFNGGENSHDRVCLGCCSRNF